MPILRNSTSIRSICLTRLPDATQQSAHALLVDCNRKAAGRQNTHTKDIATFFVPLSFPYRALQCITSVHPAAVAVAAAWLLLRYWDIAFHYTHLVRLSSSFSATVRRRTTYVLAGGSRCTVRHGRGMCGAAPAS